MRGLWVCMGLAATIACGSAETTEEPVEAPVEAPVETPAVDQEDVEPAAPASPAEMVESAGMAQQVAAAIGESSYDLKIRDKELVALRTGVLAAEVVVGHRALSDEQLAAHIEAIRTGLSQVGAGPEADERAAQLAEKVRAGAVSRDELQAELDHIAVAFPEELEKQKKGWAKPFFEAGSWVRTTHLLSLVVAESSSEAGQEALHHPEAIAYFRRELAEKGKGKASDKVLFTVDRTLERMRVLFAKNESLTKKELNEITELTSSLLDLVREPPPK